MGLELEQTQPTELEQIENEGAALRDHIETEEAQEQNEPEPVSVAAVEREGQALREQLEAGPATIHEQAEQPAARQPEAQQPRAESKYAKAKASARARETAERQQADFVRQQEEASRQWQEQQRAYQEQQQRASEIRHDLALQQAIQYSPDQFASAANFYDQEARAAAAEGDEDKARQLNATAQQCMRAAEQVAGIHQHAQFVQTYEAHADRAFKETPAAANPDSPIGQIILGLLQSAPILQSLPDGFWQAYQTAKLLMKKGVKKADDLKTLGDSLRQVLAQQERL